MKISPPRPLRIDREALLADVAQRLEGRLPSWAAGLVGDPTDPAWMLLEEAAWMVEALSEQLDQYPLAVLRQLLHLSGGERHPALPAVGAVSLLPTSPGVLREPPEMPGALVLTTAQTETRDAVGFVLAEPAVAVRPAALVSLTELTDGQLRLAGAPWREGAEASSVWISAPPRPSAAFAGERLVWTLVSATPERTLASIQAAAERAAAEGPAWLRLSTAQTGEGQIEVVATVDVAAALRAVGAVTTGGDLELRWGTLPESRWSPVVRFASDPRLPLELRGELPQPGRAPDSLLLPDLPPHLSTEGLLVRDPTPIPPAVRDSIWRLILAQNVELSALRPSLRHTLTEPEAADEPRWLEAALGAEHWEALSRGRRTALEIRIPASARGAGRLRLAVQRPPRRVALQGLSALVIEGGRLGAVTPILLWRLPVPAGAGEGRLDELVALEVELGPGAEGLLLVDEGPVRLAMLNPALVVNAPVVRDGRVVPLERGVPEAISLRTEDVVGPEVRERLLEQALPPEARAALANLPLSSMTVSDHSRILDFEGVGLDASAGQLTLNAPDGRGELRALRRGQAVTIGWYRRTDGEAGNVEPGEIAFVDQRPGERPRLAGVCNPTPTRYGADRESDADATDRLFGAPADAPVLASDWERLIRGAVGARGRGWTVRCWTYAERTLVSHSLWPADAQDPDVEALSRALRRAGPDTLLVALGPLDRILTEQELSSATSAIEAVVRRVRERNPSIRAALVTRLWPLTLRLSPGSEAPITPCFDASRARGELSDPTGRRSPSPAQGLLLNAVVAAVQGAVGWPS